MFILPFLRSLLNPLFLIGLLLLAVAYYLGYEYSFFSTTYLSLTIFYFFLYSIVIVEIRLWQAKKYDHIDCGSLPEWVSIFHIFSSIVAGILIILNWKLFVIIFIVRYILKLLPILETFGSLLMKPFFIPPKDRD